MNRVDLIELGHLRVTSPYSSTGTPKKNEVPIQRNGFSFIEKPLRVIVTLEKPDVIYTDDFASQISAYLLSGKTVEVNCGVDSKKAVFVCQELVSGGALEKIKRQDGQEIKTQTYTERKRNSFWDFFGKKHLIVSLTKVKNPKVIISTQRQPAQEEFAFVPLAPALEAYDEQDQKLDEEEVDRFFASYGKFTNAPILELEGPLQDYFQEIEKLIKEHGIVEIKRKDLLGNVDFFGLYVEKEVDNQEIVINLNGQDEVHFEEIFVPLVKYFIEKGERVLVDHDALDPYELENKIYESSIYNSICEQTIAELRVEEKEINPFTKEKRIYVVIQP